jgi:hypothetical protein
MKNLIVAVALGLSITSGAVMATPLPYHSGTYQLFLPTDETKYIQYSVTFCLSTDPLCTIGPKIANGRDPNAKSDPNFYSNPTFTTACIPLNAKVDNHLMAGSSFLINSINAYSLLTQAKTEEGTYYHELAPTNTVTSIYLQDRLAPSTAISVVNWGLVCSQNPDSPTGGTCEYNTSNGKGTNYVPTLYLHGGDKIDCQPSTIESTEAEHPDLTGFVF